MSIYLERWYGEYMTAALCLLRGEPAVEITIDGNGSNNYGAWAKIDRKEVTELRDFLNLFLAQEQEPKA